MPHHCHLKTTSLHCDIAGRREMCLPMSQAAHSTRMRAVGRHLERLQEGDDRGL
jgi:hypothetical protein